MTSTEIINHINSLEVKYQVATEQLAERMQNSVDAGKFYAVAMTTEEVAKLHGVSTARVRDYAKRGLIELHPNSTDAKLLFRGSEALKINFSELRKEKSKLKW